METQTKESYLDSIYSDPTHPASFGGIDVLYQFVKQDKKFKFNKGEIIDFLQSRPTYTSRTNKRRPRRFPPVTTGGVNELIMSDVAYMPKSGHKRFILGVIDGFSRKIKAKALTNIKAKTVVPALLELIKELGGTRYLNTDAGSEYTNALLREELKKAKIEHYISTGRSKASIMERSWRTLKSRLAKASESKGTKGWDKLLPEVVEAYNSKKHRALMGATPNRIASDPEQAADLWFKTREEQLKQQVKDIPYQYEINDGVRIKLATRSAFQKESSVRNSPRVYFIAARRKLHGIPLYKLKTHTNDSLTSSYAHDQLQKVTVSDKSRYRIEKILSYKNIEGISHAKIRWQDYGPDFDTYLPRSEVEGYFAANPDFQLQTQPAADPQE